MMKKSNRFCLCGHGFGAHEHDGDHPCIVCPCREFALDDRGFFFAPFLCMFALLLATSLSAAEHHSKPGDGLEFVLGLVIGVPLLFVGALAIGAIRSRRGRHPKWCVVFPLLATLFLISLSAQRLPRPLKPPVFTPIKSSLTLIDFPIDRPAWHYNEPGQDGSSRYALDGGATLDCRGDDGLLMTSARRNAAGAFLFWVPQGTTALDCQEEPTIHLHVTVKVGTMLPFDPRRRRAVTPPAVPFTIVYGLELLAMPPTATFEHGRDAVLTGVATEGPNKGKRVWIVRAVQGGLPLPPKCAALGSELFCVVWP